MLMVGEPSWTDEPPEERLLIPPDELRARSIRLTRFCSSRLRFSRASSWNAPGDELEREVRVMPGVCGSASINHEIESEPERDDVRERGGLPGECGVRSECGASGEVGRRVWGERGRELEMVKSTVPSSSPE